MTGFEIFWPMVAHVALVLVLYALLSARRFAVVEAGKAEASQFRENRDEPTESLLHDSLNRNRFKDKIMQQFKVLQRPLCV